MAGRKGGATGNSPTPLSTAPNGCNRPAGPSKSAASRPEVRIFVSYSHLDDASRERLAKHLAPLAREDVNIWFDGDLDAGDELDPEISRALRRAHLFVALISSSYLSSNYCWKKEYMRAMGRRTRGAIHVVGVVLKPCDWKNTKAARFKQLPKDGRAVTDWRSADHAYLDVTEGIRKVVKAIRKELTAQTAETAAQSRARKAGAPGGRKAALKGESGPKPPEASKKRQKSRPKYMQGPARAPGSGKASPEVRRVRRPR